jgi:hypothetical protein
MKNVDVEIYMNQLIGFFENNPNVLLDRIGSLHKEEFYIKLRKQAEKNLKDGNDIVLTRDQILNIVIELKVPEIIDEKPNNLEKIIQKTKFGDIILN